MSRTNTLLLYFNGTRLLFLVFAHACSQDEGRAFGPPALDAHLAAR